MVVHAYEEMQLIMSETLKTDCISSYDVYLNTMNEVNSVGMCGVWWRGTICGLMNGLHALLVV